MDLITTTEELAATCERLAAHPFVTIDTEFLRETTYYPLLCVAQLASSDEHGETKSYTVECASPGILNRVGWKFNMIKPGDKITVIIAPLKTGESGGLLKQVTLADGRVFSNGGPAGKANIK